jgi:hypothetical protein
MVPSALSAPVMPVASATAARACRAGCRSERSVHWLGRLTWIDPARITAARQLIADSEERLVAAESVFAANRYAVCDLNAVRDMLRRVRIWKNDSDAAVTLAFGFIGTKWLRKTPEEAIAGPDLIDHLCALADAERQKHAA